MAVPAAAKPTGAPSCIGQCVRSKKDEDRATWLQVVVAGEPLVCVLIADGHGGQVAAQLCSERALPYVVADAADDASATSLQAAISSAFERLHKDVLDISGTAGATLTIIVWNAARSELTLGNAGDSAAMLVEADESTTLTTDHRLSENEAEVARVVGLGAQLGRMRLPDGSGPGGPIRAYPGGLAVCRTIGDADCPYASAAPSVRTVVCSPSAAVVACSDGVWDALPAERVAAYTRECATAAEAAERVVNKAVKARGLRDDTTCIVVHLGTPPAWAASAALRQQHGSGFGRLFRRGGNTGSPGSASPPSSPLGSPMSSPVASFNNLAALGSSSPQPGSPIFDGIDALVPRLPQLQLSPSPSEKDERSEEVVPVVVPTAPTVFKVGL